MKKQFKTVLAALLVLAAFGVSRSFNPPSAQTSENPAASQQTSGAAVGAPSLPTEPTLPTAEIHGSDMIKQLYTDNKTNVYVSGEGVVSRVLDDDNSGSRHQRFILELDSGQTLLIAHNIDVGERLDGLSVGDTVAFCGEYIWTEQGGTVHWTHRTPDGADAGGRLEWNGAVYR